LRGTLPVFRVHVIETHGYNIKVPSDSTQDWRTMAPNGNQKGQNAFILSIASGLPIKEAAKAAGISERTAHRRLDDRVTKSSVKEARCAMLQDAVSRLAAASTGAAETLRKLTKAKSEQVQLAAARSILELSHRLKEATEFESRLVDLERKLDETEHAK